MSSILNVVLCQKNRKFKISVVEGNTKEIIKCISSDSESHAFNIFLAVLQSPTTTFHKNKYSEIVVKNRHRFSQNEECIVGTECKGLSKEIVNRVDRYIKKYINKNQTMTAVTT